MTQYINKVAVIMEIESYINSFCDRNGYLEDAETNSLTYETLCNLKNSIDDLETQEVDLEKEISEYFVEHSDEFFSDKYKLIAKHFYELGIKAQHDNWKVVNNINPPQADKNKIYCVLSKKNKYLLAKVINHPKDEELLQWRCTEFPFHRYDMCEGDKYMQIV